MPGATPRRSRQGGFTLHESVISLSLVGLIGGGIFTMMRDSDSVFDKSMRSSQARTDGREFLADFRRELEQASAASLVIDPAPASHDAVLFQVPLDVVGGVVQWGADRFDGGQTTTYNGAFASYFLQPDVNGFQLVRRVVDAGGALLAADQIILRNIDAPTVAGGKGLAVTRNGNLLNLSIRLRMGQTAGAQSSGNEVVRTLTATVRLRNL